MICFDRITFDSQIMGGRACVRGMRVTVCSKSLLSFRLSYEA